MTAAPQAQAAVRAPDVSIIVVTFNSRAWASAAIRSARGSAAAAGLTSEVIVVDNASSDGTPEAIRADDPTAKVIGRATNSGFGTGNNRAFEIATGETWLLVNPDVELEPDAVGQLVGQLRVRSRLAAVAPSLVGGGMERAESAGMSPGLRSALGHFLFVNRILREGRGGPWRGFMVPRTSNATLQIVDWASAAVLAVRPTAIREAGGFDERIFMYGEDIDLCQRLRRHGWEVGLCPSAHATHLISSGAVRTQWIDALHDAVRADGGRVRLAAFDLIMAAGLAVRVLAASASAARAREPERRQQRRLHATRMARGATRALELAKGTMLGQ